MKKINIPINIEIGLDAINCFLTNDEESYIRQELEILFKSMGMEVLKIKINEN